MRKKGNQSRGNKRRERKKRGERENDIGKDHYVVDSDLETIPDSDDNTDATVPPPESSDSEDDVGIPKVFDGIDARDHYVEGYTTDEGSVDEFVKETEDCYGFEGYEFGLHEGLPDVSILYAGMEWPTIKKARHYLKRHAIFHHFRIKYQKNCPKRLRAQCADPECDWFCNITRLRDGYTARCKKLGPEHTCFNDHEFYNPHADARWVAEVIETKLRAHPTWRTKDIVAEIYHDHTVDVSYWVAWNAKRMLQNKIYGTLEDGYRLAPVICAEVLRTNPGSIATCSIDNIDGGFSHMCIAFKASLDGFVAGCRPLIGLDGCHLTHK